MPSLLGTRIGHFRIVDLLGQGGMGEVYVGYDEKLERRVALKIIRSDRRLDADVKSRFLREARVLSQLAHPNICQIFDCIESGGIDILVLELIDGRSLTKAMKKGLDYRQKLDIADQIAGVLMAAHEKGIVHRDLKPDNVMLTDGDQVKVLDFGLSRLQRDEVTKTLVPPRAEEPTHADPSGLAAEAGRLLADEGTARPSSSSPVAESVALTTMGTILGTLSHMSPEQARGEVASTASDLYSFGLILQELFTGKPPYEKGLDPAVLQQKVMAGETLPADGIDTELATLIGRLKSFSPAIRPSAVDTAERLAWIRHKPLRRRKKILIAAAMVVLTLFGVAMTFQTIRATRAEKAARQEAGISKQVSEFLVGLFKVSDPGEAKGNNVTARELLDKGAEKIQKELKDQPEIQARLMDTMGVVYLKLGLYLRAQPLLETALAIREKALGPDHPDVAKALNNLANLYNNQGNYAKAEPLWRRSLKIREKALGPDHPDVAKSLNGFVNLYSDQGKYAEAEPLCQRSLRILEKALGPNDPDVAVALNNLAILCARQGKYGEAEPLFQRSLKIREKTLGPDHPDVASALNNLANICAEQGKFKDAEPLFQRNLKIREKTLGPDHPDVASALNNLANLYKGEGRYADAEPLCLRSLKIREKALGPDHPEVAESLLGLANLYTGQGKYADAEPLYQGSLKIYEKALGPDSRYVAANLTNLANVYTYQGKYGDAEPLFQRSLKIYEKALGPDHPEVASVLYSLGCLNARRGKRAEALGFLRRALSIAGDRPVMGSIGKEPDLVSLHGTPEFERIVAEVNKRQEAKQATQKRGM